MDEPFEVNMQNLLTSIARAAVVALLAIGPGRAHATNFDLMLTGAVAQGSFSEQTFGDLHFDQWALSLQGLDFDSAFTISQGDTVTATLTLDQSFTIPASVDLTFFSFFLRGADFPAGATGTTGTTSFFNLDVPGLASGAVSAGTSGSIVSNAVFFPPDNGPITFNKVVSSFTIVTLVQPAMVDNALIQYTLQSPAVVPEPETYAMLIAGLGLLVSATRRMRGRQT
jgi:PEP-CTERM motif